MITDEQKILEILGIIALRKSELYSKIVNELSKEKDLSEKNLEQIKQMISEIKNNNLISLEEKENKKINFLLDLEKINLDFEKIKKIVKMKLE